MGDKGTGKTSLYNMLQRKRFEQSYSHTPQNQSTDIPWEFRCRFINKTILSNP